MAVMGESAPFPHVTTRPICSPATDNGVALTQVCAWPLGLLNLCISPLFITFLLLQERSQSSHLGN